MTHIVVLGAGYAGLGAAKRVARRLRRTGTKVTLINAAEHFVERVRLHRLAAGQRLRDLPLRDLLDGTGVELVVARVTAIDAEARVVRLSTAPYVVGYDTLVYALGSRADVESVPGVREHAFTIAEADQALRFRPQAARITESGGALAVAGGGLTGIEAAAELAETYPGLRVELVTSGTVGGWLSARGRRYLHDALGRMGIAVREHTRITEVNGHGLVLGGGRLAGADAVLWAAGFRVPRLAAEAGFAVDGRDRMKVDDRLRSISHPEVYAIGDAAAAHAPDGSEARMSCQTGLPMGACAADLIADRLTERDPKPPRIRYVWQNISLGRRDGLTQFTHADDSSRDVILTGLAAARFKETITRGTVQFMRHPGPYLPRRRPRPSRQTAAW